MFREVFRYMATCIENEINNYLCEICIGSNLETAERIQDRLFLYSKLMTKRLVDVVLSLSFLILSLPLMLVISIIVTYTMIL